MMACKDCRFYDLAAVKDKAGRIRKGRVARCNWTVPTEWKIPTSVTTGFAYRPLGNGRRMEPLDGTDCPAKEPAHD